MRAGATSNDDYESDEIKNALYVNMCTCTNRTMRCNSESVNRMLTALCTFVVRFISNQRRVPYLLRHRIECTAKSTRLPNPFGTSMWMFGSKRSEMVNTNIHINCSISMCRGRPLGCNMTENRFVSHFLFENCFIFRNHYVFI